MVSWFVKSALMRLAGDVEGLTEAPADRRGWAALIFASPRREGASISPSGDTQARALPRPRETFVNTWSVEGFIAEGFQPAELGWGTHETWFPETARRHGRGCEGGGLAEPSRRDHPGA